MKKLIVVRHGRYDNSTNSLTEEGRDDILKSLRRIQSKIDRDGLVIDRVVSTHFQRTKESAEIVVSELGLECGVVEITLNSESLFARDLGLLHRVMRKLGEGDDTVDTTVFVCHLPNIESFLGHLSLVQFRMSVHLKETINRDKEYENGEVCFIDFDNKIVTQ